MINRILISRLAIIFLFFCSSVEAKNISNHEDEIEDYLSLMTLEEKVGQLFMVEIGHISPQEVKKYKVGAILNGGGSFPRGKANHSPQDWISLADEYYLSSSSNIGNRYSFPVIWGTDAVHGHNNLKGATIFPHNIGLGATRNAELVKKIGVITAKEVSATGLDLTFAPAVSVPRDDRWGRTYEGFSENPELVALLGKSLVLGLQGRPGGNFLTTDKVLATAKHFIGDGGTLNGVDKGNTVLLESDLKRIHLQGYLSTIEAGVQVVMASFNSWNGLKLHGNKYLLTNLLKEELNFDGIVLGDWNGHQEVSGCSAENCPQAINSGLDMFMVTDSWKSLLQNTIKQVKEGVISEERLNDAVTRVLRVKLRFNILEKGKPSSRVTNKDIRSIGSKDHRKIARLAVQQSIVLLKNNNNTLPLSPSKNILVIGSAAKTISRSTGGWSFTWQGSNTENSDFPGATSIYEGIAQTVLAHKGVIEFSAKGNFKNKPDVAILVIGENPYAEYQGSVNDLFFEEVDFNYIETASQLKKEGIPIVTIFLSGRPMWVNRELNRSDAFVAAWLPGSEGAGVADVLFSNSSRKDQIDFRGKLSFSWPQEANQTSLNFDDKEYLPLFPYGYGLDYQDSIQVGLFSEEINNITGSKLGKVLLEGWPRTGTEVIIISESGQSTFNAKRIQTPQKEVTLEIFDNILQEDSQRIYFKPGYESQWTLQSLIPLNWVKEEQASGILTFQIRILETDQMESLFFFSSCGATCGVSLSLGNFLNKIPLNKWATVGIPLNCLKKEGLDLTKLSIPVGLNTKGNWSIEIGKVYLEGGMGGKSIYPCP
jgi:beta-glucosidase